MSHTPQLLDDADITALCDVRVEKRSFKDEDGKGREYNTLILDFGDDLTVEVKTTPIMKQAIFFALKTSGVK